MPTTSDQPSNTAAPIRFIVDEPGIDTELGIKGRGYSPDNGQHFFVQNTTKGRVFRLLDAQRLYPLLKPMFDQVYGGPIETSLHWADILDKPDLALKSDLPDLSGYALKKDVPNVDGFLKLSDLSNYAKLSDLTAYAKKDDLSRYATKDDLSGKADTLALDAVKSTADSASSTASSAQETAQEALSTANSASNTASSAYSLASSANSTATNAQNAVNRLATVDTSSQYTNKTPSDYSDGFYREIKSMTVLGINRANLSEDAQSGDMALVETFSYSGYVRQTVKVLDGQRPMTFKRNGSGSSWYPWEVVHTTGGDWLQG